MKKRITALAVLVILILAATLTACSKDKNDKIIVATIDGEEITRTEFLKNWESKKASIGITQEVLDNPAYTDQINEIREGVVKTLVTQQVLKLEFEELGYFDLTQAEHEDVKTRISAFKQSILAEYESDILAELGSDYNEKDYVKAINKYTQRALDEAGIDEDFLKETFTYEKAIERVEVELLDLTVTDENIMALYTEKAEADKELFTDLSAYAYYTGQGNYQPFYIPEGLRNIRHVLIIFDEASRNSILEQRSTGNDEAADKLVEAAWESIYDEANDVLTQLKNGTITFDTAILNYNADPGMESNPNGYEVFEGNTSYVPEFTEGAMELKNVGDISELVGTDYGYHILEYTSDVESGPIDFELVKDSLMAESIDAKKNTEWMALIEEFTAKHDIVYFLENTYEEPIEEIPEPVDPK